MSDLRVRRKKRKKRGNLLTNILLVMCVALFCYSAYRLGKIGWDYYKNKQESNEMAEIFHEDDQPVSLVEEEEIPTPEPETLQQKFARLSAINDDIKAWLTVGNTNIDYAVVQSSDNDYYLRRNIYREYSYSGSIFMDYRCSIWDEDTKNIIIYGHNMKAETMFHNLRYFKSESVFNDDGSIVTLYTPEGVITAKIFSVYVTGTDFKYLQARFDDTQKYKEYLDSITSKSRFASDVQVCEDDRIITLSTCDYEFKNARLVVHAKIIK